MVKNCLRLCFLMFLLFLFAGTAHAQAVIGNSCPASGQNAITANGTPVVCTGSPLVWTAVGGGGGLTSVGPVINVTNPTYGASSSLNDNNAAFTAAMAAAATVSKVGTGIPTFKASASNVSASGTSIVVTINIAVGDCVIVFPAEAFAGSFSVTDSGGNFYALAGSQLSNGSAVTLGAFMTPAPRCATASATSVTLSATGGAQIISALVATFTNVGSYRFAGSSINTNTAPSLAQQTNGGNSLLVTGISWANGSAITAAQNQGTLQTTFASSATVSGGAIVTQSSANPANVTNSATLSSSVAWAEYSFELLGFSAVQPSVYIPYGYYYYSGGLAMGVPMKLQCEPGTMLYYTGSAHGVDVGPSGLSPTGTGQHAPYIIDGCGFDGGSKMTQGIYLNAAVENVGIRNNYFHNFCTPTAFSIAGDSSNWDVEVGPQNRFQMDNGIACAGFVTGNLTHFDDNSFFRVHDNQMWCISNAAGALSYANCTFAQAFPFIILDGAQNRVYHNNLMFGNPSIEFICNNAPCYGNQVEQNQIETVANGAVRAIKFGGTQQAMLISQNVVNLHSSACFVGPVGGTDTIQGMRLNFNVIYNSNAGCPSVIQNNVTGQTGNLSYSNVCTTGPCPQLHTTGANINAWSGDNYVSLAFAASTTATATFQVTYNSAPTCVIPTNIPGTATTLTITTLSTTQLVITASASNSATVTAVCSSGDGQ